MRVRAVLACAVLAASACGRGEPVTGSSCPHDPGLDRAAPIEVRVGPVATKIRHDLGMASLAALPGTEALGPGNKLQGLIMVEHALSYKTGIALARRGLFSPGRCAWIDHLTVDLTPKSVTILVPSEYPEDSCEYAQILAHERQHEETHRDALNDAAGDMRSALAKAAWLPARGTPMTVADRAEAEKRIEALVERTTRPVFASFQEKLKERQAVIDLPENYAWVTRRCGHWK